MSSVTPLRFVPCSRSAPPRGNSDGSEVRLAHGDEIAVNTVAATLLSAHPHRRRWPA
jgi:hypothetical protein